MSWQDDPVIEAPKTDQNGGGWQSDPIVEAPKSFLSETAQNAGKEYTDFAKGMVDPTGIARSGLELLQGKNPEETTTGGMIKKGYEQVTNPLETLKDVGQGMINPILHPIDTFKKQPISTTVGAAMGLEGLGKGPAGLAEELGLKSAPKLEAAAPVSELAEAAPKVAPAPAPINLPPEAGQILKEANKSVEPPGVAPAEPAPLGGIADKTREIKDYVSRSYGHAADKPGMPAKIADYVQGKSQMMSLQQMGFTPGQDRNLGTDATQVRAAQRAIGQYGIDSGIVGPTNGLDGMIERNHALLKQAGAEIGRIRKLADSTGPAYAPGELKALVQAKLGPVYQEEVLAKPMPSGKHPPVPLDKITSHSDAADFATAMNHEATVSTKMTQSPGHYTDLANTISEINNERLKAKLSPSAVAKYEQGLREFGINKKIGNALKYKTSGEVKRFGPGSFLSNMTQKAMDEVGYRVGAKAANKLSTSILNNPSIAKSLPSLFKEFINHVEETGHEVSGLAEGGMITPEMGNFVRGQK